MLSKVKQLFNDGFLSWRNPFALTIYCMIASIICAILIYVANYQAMWIKMLGIAIGMFTFCMLVFCSVGIIGNLKDKKKFSGEKTAK